jgi:hypothetical protein
MPFEGPRFVDGIYESSNVKKMIHGSKDRVTFATSVFLDNVAFRPTKNEKPRIVDNDVWSPPWILLY